MPGFLIQVKYLGKETKKFFRDQEPNSLIRYCKFLVEYADTLPNQYFYSSSRKNNTFIWINESFLGGKLEKYFQENKSYKFLVNLGAGKGTEFKINNANFLVLKSHQYFDKVVKKMGFWEAKENEFFYENKGKQEENNPSEQKNDSKWVRIVWIILPILLFALILLIIVRWMNKKNK